MTFVEIMLIIAWLGTVAIARDGWKRYARARNLARRNYWYSGTNWYAPGRMNGVQSLSFKQAWKELESDTPTTAPRAEIPGTWMDAT